MSNYDIIRKAIQEKKCITCNYNGYIRRMSPHVIGISKKGVEQTLCYQYAGDSSKGLSTDPSKNWRCIEVVKISNLIINDDDFESASNHSRPQSCVDDVDVEVSF